MHPEVFKGPLPFCIGWGSIALLQCLALSVKAVLSILLSVLFIKCGILWPFLLCGCIYIYIKASYVVL